VKTLLVAFVLLVACGGSETPSTETPGSQAVSSPASSAPAAAPEKEKHHHHGATPELEAFHDILAPRWHSDPGAERTKQTCDAMDDFKARAQALAGAAPPSGAAPDAWSKAGGELKSAVADLATACSGNAAQDVFDAAFSRVHDAFHAAMELASGKHEGGGEQHHQGGHE
jgi:ABC-type glycerol-3-phosphate transport system substrate-binding protein